MVMRRDRFVVGSETIMATDDMSMSEGSPGPRLPDPSKPCHAVDRQGKTLCGAGIGADSRWPRGNIFWKIDWVSADNLVKCGSCSAEYDRRTAEA